MKLDTTILCKEVVIMTRYLEIIRLTGLVYSQRNIMESCGGAQETVVTIYDFLCFLHHQ